jgi:fatty-acyl-CoA synthase
MAKPSYVHGASVAPFIGDTIGVHFDRMAERFAQRGALIVRHQGIRWSWRELKQRVDDFAAGLVALGLEPGSGSGCGRRTTPSGSSPNSPPPRPG